MTFKRDRLQEFLERTEGEPPPVFVGREDVLSDIRLAARQVWKGAGALAHGAAKTTRIIQGAPGAGKSSILAELKSRSLDGGDASSPRVLMLNSDMLEEDLPHILDLLRETGRLGQNEWIERGRKLMDRTKRQFQSVNVAAIGVELRKHHLGGLLALRESLPPERWARPVIVAVDEAQGLRPDRNSPHGLFLRGIHGGLSGLPVTQVLAGLGDTRDTVEKMHITRISADYQHDIGCFSAADISFLMMESCTHFGIDTIGHEERLEGLATLANGWPRHLHFALRALGRAALAADGDLTRVDWGTAAREATDGRRRYYERQRSDPMRDCNRLVAKVLRAVPDGDPAASGRRRNDIMKMIKETIADEPGYWVPDGWKVRDVFRHLVHQGALQRTGDGDRYHCPIPSFRRHLLEVGGLDPDMGMAPSLEAHRPDDPMDGHGAA